MSEAYSQAAKRLLAGLDAKAKLVRLPITPAGRALLRRELKQGDASKVVLFNRNFDHEASNFNLKASEH